MKGYLKELTKPSNWEIEPEYLEGHQTGYGEIYYLGDGVFKEAAEELREIEALLREAMKALEPFGSDAELFKNSEATARPIYKTGNVSRFTVGDFRTAAKLHARIKEVMNSQ